MLHGRLEAPAHTPIDERFKGAQRKSVNGSAWQSAIMIALAFGYC
jgi:hypothetical protein